MPRKSTKYNPCKEYRPWSFGKKKKRKKRNSGDGDAQAEAAAAPESTELECQLCDFTVDSGESLRKSRKMLRKHVMAGHAAEVGYVHMT